MLISRLVYLVVAYLRSVVMSEVDISVVIPAYHGEKTIALCLESVERATMGRRREIIVVDSSASDETSAVVRRFPHVTLIRSKERLSAGGARNVGGEAARARLVFFVDQDCVVQPDWVDRLQRHLEDPMIGAAGGAVGIQNPWNMSGCALYFMEFYTHLPGASRRNQNGNFLLGCNCCCRADVFQVVRFPDQTLGEDIIFSTRLRSHGFQIVYDPSTIVLHKNRKGWGWFFEYNCKMGRAAADYHRRLQTWWARPFLRWPMLAFCSPPVILSTIAMNLLRSRWSYLLRFLLLSPMCLLGNLVWAKGFRQNVLETRARSTELR